MDKVNFYTNDEGELVKQSTSRKALIFKKGKLMFVNNEHSGEKCIPGGREQIGENVYDTLVREIIEETSLECIKLIKYSLIHEDAAIFRWYEDNKLRHIDKKWYLCDVELHKAENCNKIIWADYVESQIFLNRESEKELLEKLYPFFK